MSTNHDFPLIVYKLMYYVTKTAGFNCHIDRVSVSTVALLKTVASGAIFSNEHHATILHIGIYSSKSTILPKMKAQSAKMSTSMRSH